MNQGGSGTDGVEDGMTMIIEDNSHYITQEYAANAELVWAMSGDYVGAEFVGLKLADLIPQAIPLASSKAVELDGFFPLWAIPENSDIPASENKFAHRMVIYPHHTNVTGAGEATADFYNIIKRSMAWILKEDGTSAIVNSKSNTLDVQLIANPVSDVARFQLNTLDNANVSLTIFSYNGQQLLSEQAYSVGASTIEVNTSTLSDGLYIYRLVSNGKSTTGKMIVEK